MKRALGIVVGLSALVSACGRINYQPRQDVSVDTASVDTASVDAPPSIDAASIDGPPTIDTPPTIDAPTDAPSSDAPPGIPLWDPRWPLRRKVRFQNATREALVGLPVALELPADVRAASQADLADIRFVDADNTTVLPHEFEAREAGGPLVWVRVPEVAPTDADFIWLYYGNPLAVTGERPTEVWDASFAFVFHFPFVAPGTVSFANSTVSPITITSTNVSAGSGLLGGHGVRFAGTGMLGITDASVLRAPSITVSAWGRDDGAAGLRTLIARQYEPVASENDFGIYSRGATSCLHIWSPPVLMGDENPCTNGGSLHLLALTATPTTYRGFHDATLLFSAALGEPIGQSMRLVTIGADLNTGGTDLVGQWQGDVDEARFETVERSPNWMNAQHAIGQGLFAVIEAE